MSYFTMPEHSAVEEAKKNRDILIPDGSYIGTVVDIEERASQDGFRCYHPRYDIETTQGIRSVTDYISLDNPKSASFSQLRLDEMAIAMLNKPVGEGYDIGDFKYKSACITIKNKPDKNGKLQPRIVDVIKIVKNVSPMTEDQKNDVLNRSGISLPQQQMPHNYEIVGDEIPF